MFLDLEYKILLDKFFFREEKRKEIKDPTLLMEQEKIWAIEDAGEKISSAISRKDVHWSFF